MDASNSNLLNVYRYLLHNLDKDEAEEFLDLLTEKQGVRTEIQAELHSCKKENFFQEKPGILATACSIALPTAANLCYRFQGLIKSPDLEMCRDLEIWNISLYYKILYNPDLPKSISNILMAQKRKIEQYVSS